MADIPKVDKSVERSRQRAEFRKGVARATAESEVIKARERGRQRRSVEKAKATQSIRERQASEAARLATYQQRTAISLEANKARQAQRIQTQENLNSLRSRQTIVDSGTRVITRTSAWSTIMMLTFLFFAMILIYILVRNGAQFGNLAATAGTWIQGLSSNKPLFIKA